MPLHTGPCEPWPWEPSCCRLPDDLDQEVIDRWRMVATRWLWLLSGRRWGPTCPLTIRPCRRSCLDEAPVTAQWHGAGPWVPYLDSGGAWRNASICGCSSGDCSCGELCEVELDAPVHDIVSVQVDGETLIPEAYRVDAPARLVRTDGECWPTCQDMAAPDGADGTFSVTYRAGLPLDEFAIAAVSELACHLIAACLPPGTKGCTDCQLPSNARRVVRQGVTVEMADPTAILAEGRTGLTTTDAWLAAVNPGRLPQAPRVYSPDARPRGRITVWP